MAKRHKSTIEKMKQEMLQSIQQAGNIGNMSLRMKLQKSNPKLWDDLDEYWNIRNMLYEDNVIGLGKGKGGSVYYIEAELESDSAEAAKCYVDDNILNKEAELYELIKNTLLNDWIKMKGYDAAIVEITACPGRKKTNGRWSRPDISVASHKVYPYVHGKFIDFTTFEIKLTQNADVTAVYEALAHRRASTHSYLLLCGKDSPTTQQSTTISDEAKKQGIGLIIAEKASDFSTWDIRLDAERVEPDPEQLNNFIASQFSIESKTMISKWVR